MCESFQPSSPPPWQATEQACSLSFYSKKIFAVASCIYMYDTHDVYDMCDMCDMYVCIICMYVWYIWYTW